MGLLMLLPVVNVKTQKIMFNFSLKR